MIRDAAIAGGMITLGEDALAKVKSGATSAEELFRVVTEVKEVRTLCPGCHAAVGVDFMACPHCGHRLNSGCPKCGRSAAGRVAVLSLLHDEHHRQADQEAAARSAEDAGAPGVERR